MEWGKNLKTKISNKNAVICIIGLGYVGLPLAIAFSKKFKVVGYDVSQEKINLLKQAISYIEDVKDEEINLESLYPTNDYKELKNCDFIIITVPTPLREDKTPDLTYIRNAGRTVGKILEKGQFVILESTTYPGTTEEVLVPILEKESGLKAIKDFGVAYSPERVDPGNKKYKIEIIDCQNALGGCKLDKSNVAYLKLVTKIIRE